VVALVAGDTGENDVPFALEFVIELQPTISGNNWETGVTNHRLITELGTFLDMPFILAFSPEFIGRSGSVAVDSINGVLIFATEGKAWVVYC
jgi:hypothetical protein